MKKKTYSAKRARQRRREVILLGVLGLLVALLVITAIVEAVTGSDELTYTVTEDGHVHASDGTHIGTVEEMFGEGSENVVVTEDGHIHAADGTHLGDVTDTAETQEDQAASTEETEQTDAAE